MSKHWSNDEAASKNSEETINCFVHKSRITAINEWLEMTNKSKNNKNGIRLRCSN